MRFYFNTEKALNDNHLGYLWEMLNTDVNEIKPAVYKVFSDIAISMKEHHVTYFMNKFS